MAYIRKRLGKWQCVIRVKGKPPTTKTFLIKKDAKLWGKKTELHFFREDNDIQKCHYPLFKECLEKYRDEVVINKRSRIMETKLISYLLKESFVSYKLNFVDSRVVALYRDRALKTLKSSSVRRRLAIVSHMYTIAKKEWGYKIENPILNIRKPKSPEPRNRRFTNDELDKLIKGNRASPKLRLIIQIALETAMRQGEILRVKPEDINGNTLFIPIAKTKPRTIPLTLKAMTLLNNAELPFNITGNALSKQFKKLCDHYEIKDAHFHDLRRQSLTNFMLEKNLSVAETMMIAGHSDPKMLLRTYNNLKVEDVAKKLVQ
jgi:integrase